MSDSPPAGGRRLARLPRLLLVLGGLNAALSVALGAAGAHALKARLVLLDPAGLFPLALHYHQMHALGLLLIGLAAFRLTPTRWLAAAAALMVTGLLLFCGTLYLRSLTGSAVWHGLVPIGGGAFILGWLAFVVAALSCGTDHSSADGANRARDG